MIYLACPYNDPDPIVRGWRVKVATRTATLLHDRGIPVFSPLTHGFYFGKHGLVRQPWDYWSRIDLPILTSACMCLAVIELQGWIESEGVTAERRAAGEVGILERHVSRCSLCGNDLSQHSPFGALRDGGVCPSPEPDVRKLLDVALDLGLYYDLQAAGESL